MLHRYVADGVHRIGEHFVNCTHRGKRPTYSVDAGYRLLAFLVGALNAIGRAPATSRRSCHHPTSTI